MASDRRSSAAMTFPERTKRLKLQEIARQLYGAWRGTARRVDQAGGRAADRPDCERAVIDFSRSTT